MSHWAERCCSGSLGQHGALISLVRTQTHTQYESPWSLANMHKAIHTYTHYTSQLCVEEKHSDRNNLTWLTTNTKVDLHLHVFLEINSSSASVSQQINSVHQQQWRPSWDNKCRPKLRYFFSTQKWITCAVWWVALLVNRRATHPTLVSPQPYNAFKPLLAHCFGFPSHILHSHRAAGSSDKSTACYYPAPRSYIRH